MGHYFLDIQYTQTVCILQYIYVYETAGAMLVAPVCKETYVKNPCKTTFFHTLQGVQGSEYIWAPP